MPQDSIRTGTCVLTLSIALVHPSSTDQREVEEALDYGAEASLSKTEARDCMRSVNRKEVIPGKRFQPIE